EPARELGGDARTQGLAPPLLPGLRAPEHRGPVRVLRGLVRGAAGDRRRLRRGVSARHRALRRLMEARRRARRAVAAGRGMRWRRSGGASGVVAAWSGDDPTLRAPHWDWSIRACHSWMLRTPETWPSAKTAFASRASTAATAADTVVK